jgi:hypothetical protein
VLVQCSRRLGFIFQAHNLNESLTAMQNVRARFLVLAVGGTLGAQMLCSRGRMRGPLRRLSTTRIPNQHGCVGLLDHKASSPGRCCTWTDSEALGSFACRCSQGSERRVAIRPGRMQTTASSRHTALNP